MVVDAGEDPNRPFCDAPCKEWNRRLLAALPTALGHLHSDLGGVPTLLDGLTLAAEEDSGGWVDFAGMCCPARGARLRVPQRLAKADRAGRIVS